MRWFRDSAAQARARSAWLPGTTTRELTVQGFGCCSDLFGDIAPLSLCRKVNSIIEPCVQPFGYSP